MIINFKTVNNKNIVTVNGKAHEFSTIKKALEFIFALRGVGTQH